MFYKSEKAFPRLTTCIEKKNIRWKGINLNLNLFRDGHQPFRLFNGANEEQTQQLPNTIIYAFSLNHEKKSPKIFYNKAHKGIEYY